MKHSIIAVFGLGYVGVVTAACLAKRGYTIVGVDPNVSKVDALNAGESPIVEPGMDELLEHARQTSRITATADYHEALQMAQIALICVGTPATPTGALDLSAVTHVSRSIATALDQREPTAGPLHLLYRSTILPGSTRALRHGVLATAVDAGRARLYFYPEFLREGSAIADFNRPALAAVGTEDGTPPPSAVAALFTTPTHAVDWETAELLKYTCNAFHATKVAFANEIGRLGKRLQIDSCRLMRLFCEDDTLNLSDYYLQPGNPFGGSCLPKDVAALTQLATSHGVDTPLLNHLHPSNEAHIAALTQLIEQQAPQQLALLGLSFKPGTDDLRGSAMVEIARRLLPQVKTLRIFDPQLNVQRLTGSNAAIIRDRLPQLETLLCAELADAITPSDCIVVAQPVAPLAELARHVTANQRIIDVNGWPNLQRLPARYEGFCW